MVLEKKSWKSYGLLVVDMEYLFKDGGYVLMLVDWDVVDFSVYSVGFLVV